MTSKQNDLAYACHFRQCRFDDVSLCTPRQISPKERFDKVTIVLRMKQILAVLLVAISVAVAGAGVATAKANDTEPRVADFATQASRAGLSAAQARTLQTKVDTEIAKRGGTQVSANEILWKDGKGKTVLVAPGQKRAASLAGDGKAAVAGCAYYYICLYEGHNRQGTMHELFYCSEYQTFYPIGSYDNNQTPGTRARFLNSNHGLFQWSEPAHSIVDYYDYKDSLEVWYVDPC